ncbi:MAG: TraB/GumN family protein [Desulfobacterota bacterium]|nr:TraB/GumN family protein [Thermodesulfobacteriota bacterium]
MVFRVEKSGKINYICGTAHFFPFSFRKSLKKLISKVNIVLFEGPLTESDMERVVASGYETSTSTSLIDLLDKNTLRILEEEYESSKSKNESEISRYFGYFQGRSKSRLEMDLRGLKPWMCFFRIWASFLKERGWTYSLDLEAHVVAKKKNKKIHYLESIDEQIRALEGIPVERFVKFLNLFRDWELFAKRYAYFYLEGDLENLLRTTELFPTRCESVVEKRDPELYRRILPFFEEGSASAFVGLTHIKGIVERLKSDGFFIFQDKC